MTAKSQPAETSPPKADLLSQYRPLGLKAVLAAALMLKTKPVAARKKVA